MPNHKTPRQDDLVTIVVATPGRARLYYARRIGPRGSTRFGYATIQRAIASKRIVCRPDPARKGVGLLFPC